MLSHCHPMDQTLVSPRRRLRSGRLVFTGVGLLVSDDPALYKQNSLYVIGYLL